MKRLLFILTTLFLLLPQIKVADISVYDSIFDATKINKFSHAVIDALQDALFQQHMQSANADGIQSALGTNGLAEEIRIATRFAAVRYLKDNYVDDKVGWTKWIPVFGNLRTAYFKAEVANGEPTFQFEAGVSVILAATDVAILKSTLEGIVKGVIKLGTKGVTEEGMATTLENTTEKMINLGDAGALTNSSLFKVGDEIITGVKINRIKYGSNTNTIYVIGTDMTNRIEPFAEALKKQGYKIELFNENYAPFIIDGKSYTWDEIQADWNKMMEANYKEQSWVPYDEPNALKNIQGTLMYKANQQFIQKALSEGNSIIDIGKTYDSYFYDMEITNVFK